jgi:predicted ArsR family transcriptional regulator
VHKTQLKEALIRLNSHRIGMAEACTLLVLADAEFGSIALIAEALDIDKPTARSRVGILKTKKLVEAHWSHDGFVSYPLTDAGRAIITHATGRP